MFVLRRIEGRTFGVFEGQVSAGTECCRGNWEECRNALIYHTFSDEIAESEHAQAMAEAEAERATERYFEERNWSGFDPRGW